MQWEIAEVQRPIAEVQRSIAVVQRSIARIRRRCGLMESLRGRPRSRMLESGP